MTTRQDTSDHKRPIIGGETTDHSASATTESVAREGSVGAQRHADFAAELGVLGAAATAKRGVEVLSAGALLQGRRKVRASKA